MSNNFNIHSQLHHKYSQLSGTGHSDISKYQWLLTQQRDTLNSLISHHPLKVYTSLAYNQSTKKTKYQHIMKMMKPTN